jgi:large subunit ribosomal protein L6
MSTVRTVQIPQGVTITLDGKNLVVKGPKGTLERNIWYPRITVAPGEGEVAISTDAGKKTVVAMVGTLEAHIRNMCKGVTNGYEYHMKVLYSHFPIQLKMQGNRLEITNFLGEKQPRYAMISSGVAAKVGNDEIVLSGINKELVGTSAANIEHATKIRNRDPRVFQDGIYIVKKA